MTGANNNADGIHATAVIYQGAKIGKNVQIGPYSVIGADVEIGDGTVIGPHVVITGWTTIGKDCKIFQHASIGEEPQDLKFVGEKSYTIIGDRTVIREGTTVHRACGEGEITKIGDDCLIMAYNHIAHNCVIGNNVIMANASMLAGHVTIEDRAVVSGISGVHQFVKIGRNAMIGGTSKIVQDVVPFTIADGNPAQAIGLNSIGMQRAGISAETRSKIKKAYKLIYMSELSLSDAADAIERDIESCEEIDHLVNFLRNVERGVCRKRKKTVIKD